MKSLKYFLISILALFIAGACDENYIDSISKVDPGPDKAAPTVNIKFPLEGSQIKSEEDVTSVKISFEAMDDIELKDISVKIDNAEIVKYDEFKDYRQVMAEYDFTNLTQGAHTLTIVATDQSGKSTTQTINFEKTSPYKAIYPGEVFYLPFEGDATEQVSNRAATLTGTPTYADGKIGKAYVGLPDTYLSFPTDSLIKTQQISAVFWMKINAVPDRAGIITMSPIDPLHPTAQNLRTSGLRFFREANGKNQIFKLNVGIGNEKEIWNDGGIVDPALGQWVHFAFTVSPTANNVYINGKMVRESKMTTPIDWAGIDLLTIMSGVPRFTEWQHFSDLSMIDELRFFNKALTIDEVTTLMNATE